MMTGYDHLSVIIMIIRFWMYHVGTDSTVGKNKGWVRISLLIRFRKFTLKL